MVRHTRQLVFILTLAVAAGFLWLWLSATHVRAEETATHRAATAIGAARARVDAGQYEEATALLRPAIEDERVPPEMMAQCFFYRGIARLELGQSLAALSDFGNAFWLEALPAQLEAEAHVHRARAYADLGRDQEASVDLEEAIRLAPDNPLVAAAMNASGFMSERAEETTTGSIEIPVSPPRREFGIQLGALVDVATARAAWERISTLHTDLLGELAPRYEKTVHDGQRLVRLRAGPLATIERSQALCAQLRDRGQDCFAVAR